MSAPSPDERKPLDSWTDSERRKAVSDHFELNRDNLDARTR